MVIFTVKVARSTVDFFAERLYNDTVGKFFGTNDAELIRIIVARSEVIRNASMWYHDKSSPGEEWYQHDGRTQTGFDEPCWMIKRIRARFMAAFRQAVCHT